MVKCEVLSTVTKVSAHQAVDSSEKFEIISKKKKRCVWGLEKVVLKLCLLNKKKRRKEE